MVNLYTLLKVEKTATSIEIKKSFYALARVVHPDKRPDDPKAAENFRALKRAYDVLMDADRRARYDKVGSIGDPDEESSFQAAYERYKCVEISTEDIDDFLSSYKESEAEIADLIKYTKKYKGNITRILESIIGSDDSDKDRFVSIITNAFDQKRIPKKLKLAFLESKEHILSIDQLDVEDLGEEDDDDDDDLNSDDLEEDSFIAADQMEEDSDQDDEEKEDDQRHPTAPRDIPSDLVAMFSARRQQRESAFDAFERKWASKSAHDDEHDKKKAAVTSSSSSLASKKKRKRRATSSPASSH